MPNGKVSASGLRILVEKFCSKTTLKIQVNKDGAYSKLDTSNLAGVRRAIKKNRNTVEENFVFKFAKTQQK